MPKYLIRVGCDEHPRRAHRGTPFERRRFGEERRQRSAAHEEQTVEERSTDEGHLWDRLDREVVAFRKKTGCRKAYGYIAAQEDIAELAVRAQTRLVEIGQIGFPVSALTCDNCGWLMQVGTSVGYGVGSHRNFCDNATCQRAMRLYERQLDGFAERDRR